MTVRAAELRRSYLEPIELLTVDVEIKRVAVV